MAHVAKRTRSSTLKGSEHELSSLHLPVPPAGNTLLSNPVASTSYPKAKRARLASSGAYDQSPFPNHIAPTPQEASAVHSVLIKAHPEYTNRPRAPVEEQANSATTCGRVDNVLDSLIGTVLSQNTSSRNSTAAKISLDATFGLHGFEAIAKAPRVAVVDTIRSGGLANRKAAIIQNILHGVHARHGTYSLQHLTKLSNADAMDELVSYDGVGPKTAACVLAFSLQRDAFAVDTHVFRLSKMLGWVPASADRVRAQAHLEERLPAALKYDLHVLMIAHGRACKGCKSGASVRHSTCALKAYIRERKGVPDEASVEKNESCDIVVASGADGGA
jgi:endonuclease-3